MYSPQILDHFEHPRNAGVVASPNAIAEVENPVCGDLLKLTARISERRIVEIKFLAKGCVPVIACASAVVEFAEGKTIAAVSALRPEELVKTLGGLPQASTHASHLTLEALALLVDQIDH
ncbi:MAG TPA: iron-sulfur cluster assembly scaffold protein [Terriglobales bacterium]|nr:iron-sulfur cluster assembly scaffold protein [Terriglobales bacterium]